MAGQSDTSSVAFIYKRKYTDKQVGDAAMREHALTSMIKKEGGFNGSAFYYAVRYGNPQGVSSAFTSAVTAVGSSSGVQFAAARRLKYGYITLDGPSLSAARGDGGAFLDLVTQESDGIMEEVGDSLAFDAWRDTTGIRGRRSSASTNVITLVTADDARNFKVGMTVYASANSDMSSARTGSTTVASIDEDAGTVTLTSAAAISSFADNDYLARLGDSSGTCMDGFAKIIPLTAPSGGDSFRGVDRSVDTRRLAGARVDDASTSIEENIGLLAVKIRQSGKKADTGFLNPINFWKVVRRLNAKVEYAGGGTAAYGFEGVDIHTPSGTVRLVSDADVPTNRAYIGKLETAYIKTLEDYVHVIREDGRPSMRLAAATGDGIEIRIRSMSNLIVTEPSAWGVCSI